MASAARGNGQWAHRAARSPGAGQAAGSRALPVQRSVPSCNLMHWGSCGQVCLYSRFIILSLKRKETYGTKTLSALISLETVSTFFPA